MATNLAKIGSSIDEARRFLEFVASGGPPNTFLSIVGIDRRKVGGERRLEFKQFPILDVGNAAEYVYSLNRREIDAYVQLTLLREVPPDGRGDRSYIAAGTLLWVDMDEKSMSKSAMFRALEAFPHKPSLINESGHGLHVYWKLDEPLTNVAEIEGRNRALVRAMGADDCWNATYILRVPGTTNWKNRALPVPVKTILSEPRVYKASDFAIQAQTGEIEETLDIDEEPFDAAILSTLAKDLYARLVHGAPEGERSENDWYVACGLLEQGFSPGQVLSLAMDNSYAFCEKAETQGVRYAIRTISRAVKECKRRAAIRPNAVLQPIINKIVLRDPKTGAERLELPKQGYALVCEAARLLESKGYKFVFDDKEGLPYMITDTGDIILASQSDRTYKARISQITLFTQESQAFRLFESGIIAYIEEFGQRASFKPWAHVDLDKGRFYVLQNHEKANDIAIIQPNQDHVIRCGNGMDNTMMLYSDITFGRNLDIAGSLETVDMVAGLRELLNLTHDYFAVPKPIKEFLTCYMLAAALCGGYITHGMLPLLHLTGRPGQGKSDILKTLMAFIHGSTEPESGTTIAGARMIAARDILMPFDDYEELAKGMKEFILTSATGAVRHKSNSGQNGVVTQRNHLLIALTSVADLPTDTLRRRALRVEVSSLRNPTPNYNSLYKDKILRNRSVFWSAYAKFVSRHILGKLTATNFHKLASPIQQAINVPEFKPHSEFMALCLFIAQELAEIDPRFAWYKDKDVLEAIQPWFSYFELCNQDAIDSYNELTGMLMQLFDQYQQDLARGDVMNRCTLKESPTRGAYLEIPMWMQGIYPEAPANLPQDIPFQQRGAITITGKIPSFVTTLQRMGYRDYFGGMANPPKQIFNIMRNMAGLSGSDIPLIHAEGRRYSGVYRLGTANLYVQFVFLDGTASSLYIRLLMPVEGYRCPTRATQTQGGMSKQAVMMAAKKMIESGEITREQAKVLLDALTKLHGTDKNERAD